MASVSGVSGNNMTSSLYNSANVISGLASGLDTEGMIESLVQSYQTKIDQLNQKATKVEWKQDAYRSIISKLVGFSNKYTSYTSSTNLTSPSFFSNAVKVLTKGAFKDSVTASGKTSSDIQLNAVHQLAQAAQFRTKSNMATGTTGTIAGKDVNLFGEDSIELSNLSGSLTFTYGSKNVSVSFSETGDVEAMNDIRKSLAKEKGIEEKDVADADVLAGLINQKLADQQIVFTNGNAESADKRIQAVANSDGTISINELGTAKNGVYISGASGNIAEKLGLGDLENAKEDKPATIKLQTNYDEGGLTRKLSGIEYLAEKSKAGAVTMNMSVDGNTKKITLPSVSIEKNEDGTEKYLLNGEEVSKSDFAAKYTDALSKSVKDAFGNKVEVSVNKSTNDNGEEQFSLSFKVAEGSDLVINSDVGDALGIGKTATSYLSTSKTLGDLLGEDKLAALTPSVDKDGNQVTDSKGNPKYDFTVNGVVVGSFSKDSTLSEVLNAINSSDAGVKAAYSQTTQSFTFTAKESGADSKIEFGDGLAQTMFGAPAESNFADAYGLDLADGEEKEVTFDLPGIKVGIKVKSGESMEDLAAKLNNYMEKYVPGSDYTFSYNKTSGQLIATDSSGKMQDLKVTNADGKELTNKSTSSYTSGQDAIFTATINGEQKLMTRSSNSVNIDGLTINMEETFNSKVDEDGNPILSNGKFQVDNARQSVTFQNKTDSDKIVDAIKSMVDDYNAMMAEIKSAYATMPYQKSSGAFANYEPLTDDDRAGMSESAIERYEEKAKQGILFGDRDLSNLYSKMSDVFSFANTRDTDTLKDMGLSLSYSISDGAQALTLDEDKLRAYLDSDPDRVAEVFTKTDGIMDRMKTQLDSYAKTTGEPKGILVQKAGTPLSSLSLLNNQWQTELDNINTQIEKWQDKLSSQVDRYTSMFSKLEVLINQMNSQSSTLAGLMGG